MSDADDAVTAVDLFCGAGGLSTGLALACEGLGREVDLVAVNHWTTAIETHQQNHEWAEHRNAKVEELHPPNVVTPGEVKILVGAPECTHFSNARGGKPVDEQKRASPWHIVDWAQKIRPQTILVENVKELESWGPVDEDGQPTRNGELFDAWVTALHAIGYSVDWRVLNAADYGEATSRERLFVIGRLGARATFPEPTHSRDGEEPGTEPWRAAAEVIDWSDPGESIWTRDRPLVNNTMQRIADGIRRHGAADLEPFAEAVAELTKADVEAMQQEPVALEDVTEEVVAERGEPFLVKYYGRSDAHQSVDEPMGTIRTNPTFALATPYLLGQQSNALPKDVTEEGVPTIATRGAISKIEPRPFVLPRNGAYRGLHSNPAYDPEDRPLHTVTAKNTDGHVVTPYLVQYHGNSGARSLEDPMPTITARDSLALVLPEHYPWGLDIRFRMLEPRELAAAMGFPDEYDIAGNKTETVKQIGNAVPVTMAKSLCEHLLTADEPTLNSYGEPTPADGGEVDAD
ncbi:DNA cytosine methyltransferase [Natronosalvus rutilus]|uniref:DNA (cytosine-5-)-methyltransferase n=1 Tax=Natronosalvus rutilus TaxID=2953753 RepID=A0A9E7NFF4_9EURY|nr:DNA cytosine methyltransferase [Natronosalvus rutilus]UTF56033.1 DNA cytosine methyltransferase [Natronosalvus rutilus]